MEKQHKDAVWVPHAEIEPEVCGKGVKRRILAYSKDAMCVENTFETGGVGAMHCHPHTQVTYIVSGRYRFTIGDETREVALIFIVTEPPAHFHRFWSLLRL